MNNELNQIDKNIQVRLLEYCKYLYEEEKERKNNLNDSVKTYIVFLTFILGVGVLKILPLEKLILLLKNKSINQNFIIFSIIVFSLSIFIFFISLIFTILILKTWKFERPSDPKITTLKSVCMENENELLSSIIADYIIACNRNHAINDKKAKLLSYALFSLITGMIFFIVSLLIFNSIFLWIGGIK